MPNHPKNEIIWILRRKLRRSWPDSWTGHNQYSLINVLQRTGFDTELNTSWTQYVFNTLWGWLGLHHAYMSNHIYHRKGPVSWIISRIMHKQKIKWAANTALATFVLLHMSLWSPLWNVALSLSPRPLPLKEAPRLFRTVHWVQQLWNKCFVNY